MTEPYYADDLVSLYLGDCREVTEWLSADVLVTDPPYGRGWTNLGYGGKPYNGGRQVVTIAGDDDTTARDDALTHWGERPAVVFGDLLLAAPARTRQVLIYAKPPGAGFQGTINGFFRDAEAIYLIGPHPKRTAAQTSVIRSGASFGGDAAKRYGHSHAKPVDVMETLIAACPPGTVADPFAGSGSTLVAARNLGRTAIGVEIEERYAEQAARRLAQGVLIA